MATLRAERTRKRRGKSNLLFRLVVVFLAVYLLFMLVQTQMQISQKKAEVESINTEIELMQSQINEINRLVSTETDSEYMERIAREQLGYISGDERVFVDINANQ